MSREWKPGDVALVKFAWGLGEHRLCMRQERNGRLGWTHASSHGNFTADEHPAGAVDIRPLAVIDPEDVPAVDRLADSLGMYGETLQTALREFANPPKPDEPTGLGAVVEDASGRRFVRIEGDSGGWAWLDGTASHKWEHVNAVRVLSEGVTA